MINEKGGYDSAIQGWEITKKLDNKQKVYMRQYSDSKVSCMKDKVKPSIRENNPDHIIFHVGTNNVPSEKTPWVIAQSIVDLVKTVANENDKLQVTVSSIVPQNHQWSKKVYEVNKILSNLCKDVNIPFISHSVIDAKRNLNNSKLHLNIRGSRKLQENFVKYLKGFSSWDNVTQNESESSNGLSTKSKESLYTANCESFLKEPQLETFLLVNIKIIFAGEI